MARDGKVIEKVEVRADGRIFKGKIRMIAGYPLSTKFRGECDDPPVRTEDKTNIDEVRTELQNAIRTKAAPGNWKKYVMVHFDFSDEVFGEESRHFVYRHDKEKAGLTLSWHYLWLGNYADGSPCYKYAEDAVATAGKHEGAGRIMLEENETSIRLDWTPEIEEGLHRVKKGIVNLSQILRDLLSPKKIERTLTNIPAPILALPAPPKPEPKRKRKQSEDR